MKENKIRDLFNIENRTRYFNHALVFLCLFSIVLFLFLVVGDQSLAKRQIKTVSQKPDPFKNIDILAKGAVVWDVVNQREIFAKNPDLPLPLASLTKVMTAVTAEEILKNNSKLKIEEEYLAPEGDSKLVVGDTWNTRDLRDFTLLTSSNDGAFALAALTQKNESIFIKSMNEKAEEIGLLNSKFFNEHGLDRDIDRGGAYGSARDMASLFEYTLQKYPEILEATRYESLEFKSDEAVYVSKNTNTVVNQIPGLLASKTGFTDLAGGNLVIAFDAGLNRPIIVSILGSTEEGRFSDTLQLVEASLKYIQQN